jgi:hypothetical protein
MVTIQQQISILDKEFKDISWTHPRNIVILPIVSKKLNYEHMLEIGTYMGAVPIMIKNLEKCLEMDCIKKFTLIENFEDHLMFKLEVTNSASLKTSILNNIPSTVDITIKNSLAQISTDVRPCFDIIHFDSVKWQYLLIKQFNTIKKYCHNDTLFVFDDYIAEWPDVIYCVDEIIKQNSLSVIATFGPKIYIGSESLKNKILEAVTDIELFNIRETILHGNVVSSGPELITS